LRIAWRIRWQFHLVEARRDVVLTLGDHPIAESTVCLRRLGTNQKSRAATFGDIERVVVLVFGDVVLVFGDEDVICISSDLT
jgi:hypothetical protein